MSEEKVRELSPLEKEIRQKVEMRYVIYSEEKGILLAYEEGKNNKPDKLKWSNDPEAEKIDKAPTFNGIRVEQILQFYRLMEDENGKARAVEVTPDLDKVFASKTALMDRLLPIW